MKTHTLGFIFDESLSKVLLIHKQRPDWQKGKINGVGGKIEPGEESLACIVREVLEETGLRTQEKEWVYLGEINSVGAYIDMYALAHRGELHEALTTTDEEIGWFEVANLPENVLNNVHWLIPLALDKLKHDDAFSHCLIQYM